MYPRRSTNNSGSKGPVSGSGPVRSTWRPISASTPVCSVVPVRGSPAAPTTERPRNQLSNHSNQLINHTNKLSNHTNKLSGKSNNSGQLRPSAPGSENRAPTCHVNRARGTVKQNVVASEGKDEVRVFEDDRENGVNVIKRKRRFGGSLRFKRSDSVLVSHPVADDSALSTTRDDNDITREILSSRDQAKSRDLVKSRDSEALHSSAKSDKQESREALVAGLKRDNEKLNKKYNESLSRFIAKNLTSKSRSLGRPDPVSRRNEKDDNLRSDLRRTILSPVKIPAITGSRPLVIPPKVKPPSSCPKIRPAAPAPSLKPNSRPDLPSPTILYDQLVTDDVTTHRDDVIASRDDVVGSAANSTRDDNDVTSYIDDTVSFAPMDETVPPQQVWF